MAEAEKEVAPEAVSATWLGTDGDEETIKQHGGRPLMGLVFPKGKAVNVSVAVNTAGEVLHKKLKSLALAGVFKLGEFDKKHGEPLGAKVYVQKPKDMAALIKKAKEAQKKKMGTV